MIVELSAGGIVYRNKKSREWLVVKHKKAGHWGFPKGHIGDNIKNEKKEEAALREVEEEGGINAKIVSDAPVSTQYFYKRNNILHKKTVYYFLMEYTSGDTKDHDDEVSAVRFVNEEELRQILTYDTDKNAFEKVKKSL